MARWEKSDRVPGIIELSRSSYGARAGCNDVGSAGSSEAPKILSLASVLTGNALKLSPTIAAYGRESAIKMRPEPVLAASAH
jgi:hypothetical protein